MKYEHLIGRQPDFGQQDCFEITRDFFRDNFDIIIRNYARPTDWNPDKLNLIELAFEKEGFEKVPNWSLKTLRPADVLCMALGSRNPCHLAIYVGNNTILHHKALSLSNTEVLRGFWRDRTCFVLRHPDVPYEEPVRPTIDIRELIDARNRIQAPA